MKIDPPTSPLSGMYYHIFRGRGSFSVLYFYPDGFVMGVTVAGDLSDMDAVRQWFTREQWGDSSDKNVGFYQTSDGKYINFELESNFGKVVYSGNIQDDAKLLELHSHSHINGHSDTRIYHLVPPKKEKNSTAIAPKVAGGAAPRIDFD